MKNRRICALLAAMVLSLSAAGCGGAGTNSPAESGTAAKESTENGSTENESAAQQENASGEKDAEQNPAADTTAAAADADGSTGEESGFEPEDSKLSEDGSVVEFPKAGVTFTLPESFKNTKGFLPSGGGEMIEGDGVFCMYYNYVALSEDDYNKLLVAYRSDQDNPQKYEDFFNPRVLGLFSVYAADKNRSAEEIGQYLKQLYQDRGTPLSDDSPMEGAQLIGRAGEYNFYFLNETQPDVEIEEDNSSFSKDYDLAGFNEEYAALVEDVKNACPGLMTFSEPEKSGNEAEPGTGVSFDAVDLDGHPVTSKDLFSQNKVTMINIWASFCGPCINEMPELEKLYAEFRKEGCGIIGVLGDAVSKEDTAIIDEGKKILSDAGVTYPNVIAWEGIDGQLPFNAFPTTYFVDAQGKVIGSPIVGANVSSYSARLREALEEIQ